MTVGGSKPLEIEGIEAKVPSAWLRVALTVISTIRHGSRYQPPTPVLSYLIDRRTDNSSPTNFTIDGPSICLQDFTSGFFGQLAHAHLPGSQGHAPVEPPQLHFVLSGFSLTFSIFAISASVPEAVFVSGFFGQLAQAHFPGSHPQLPVSAWQLHVVFSVPGTVSGVDLPAFMSARRRASAWTSRTCF